MANQGILEKNKAPDFESSSRSTSDNTAVLHTGPVDVIALGASEEIDTCGNQEENTQNNPVVTNGVAQDVQQHSTSTSVITDIDGESLLNSPFPVRGVVVIKEGVEQFQAVEAANEAVETIQADSNAVSEVEVSQGTISCITNDHLIQNTEPSYVVIEQVALEQLNQLIAASQNTAAVIEQNIIMTNSVVEPTTAGQPNTATCFSTQDSSVSESTAIEERELKEVDQVESSVDQELPSLDDDEDVELDTKALATQLTAELKRYSIPQAVFAKKVLHRSQGTLSDILRKPKPWCELKGGREIFKRMKQWLDLPEVKRIPQLRIEGMNVILTIPV